MLVDILSADNYNTYNIKLAEKLGLEAAVYISTITNIYNKAKNKNKLIDDAYFKVDREYIRTRTTLTREVQRDIEDKLSQINLIVKKPDNKDILKIDLTILTSVISSDDINITKNLNSIVKKKTKADSVKYELKRTIVTTNGELRDAYSSWIDAVIAKDGWMTKAAVENGQKLIDSFTNRNLDAALDILTIAAINGYRDIEWAINKYKESNKNNMNAQSKRKDVSLSSEVF